MPSREATTMDMPRLKKLYSEKLVLEIQKKLGLKNVSQVPKIEKIVVSVGLGRSKDDKRMFEVASNTLAKITGQHPVTTKSRKSIAGFKLREGQAIGMKVTLRDQRMYEFLDRLIQTVLPRVRDFHGVSNHGFDGHGNYSIGFAEQSVFPELSYDDVSTPHGLQVTINTNAKDSEPAKVLLESLGMPFAKENK
ncbi:50S ribosomal protein L5 [Candidatus Saccharibacteria bacterium CPR2]|nr:50S ribosomal protein L5 [Candidatus Saccharibacteria bacterium CPR2]